MSGMFEPGRTEKILAGLRGQNDIATFEGAGGYWVQGDCVFIQNSSPTGAIDEYRQKLGRASIACSHNHFCDGIIAAKGRDGVVENQVDRLTLALRLVTEERNVLWAKMREIEKFIEDEMKKLEKP